MAYVDFFMLPLPEGNESEYLKQAQVFLDVMKGFGLLRYCEALSDDVPHGQITDYYRAVAARDNEKVVCAFAVWPDKKTRDHAWSEGMKDPRMAEADGHKRLFDGKRMVYGGFAPLFDYQL
ncbi:MAG TPA: DUF1428 family protein [Polyangiaceae bacterium]|nr:DUF1428 family protein [Polyangiaceae bacterium]